MVGGMGALGAAEPRVPGMLVTKDTVIGKLALLIAHESIRVSPDGEHLAFAAKAGDPTLEERGVFLDRAAEERPAARPQSELTMYLDDKRGPSFLALTSPVFSPDSKRMGYAGQKKDAWEVWVDKKVVWKAEGVPANPLVFSGDSARYAITYMKEGDWFVRLGEKDYAGLDGVGEGSVQFSPDGKKLAYAAKKRLVWNMYIEGEAGEDFVRMGESVWMPNSSGVIFVAGKKEKGWQVRGREFTGPVVEGVLRGSLTVAREGNRWAYVAVTKKGTTTSYQVMTNDPSRADGGRGVEGPVLAQIKGESLRFMRLQGQEERLVYVGMREGKYRMYEEHQPSAAAWDLVLDSTFVMSPNGDHYAFAGRTGGKCEMVLDGRVIGRYGDVGSSTVAFSPDSKRLAYGAEAGGQWHMCVDGEMGTAVLSVASNPPGWSPDSKRVAFQAIDAGKLWRLFVDAEITEQSAAYVTFFKGARVVWRGDGTLVTIGIQKKLALRVEAVVGKGR